MSDDLISRQSAIQHLKKRLYETALNNITEHPYYEEMADNRVDVWLNELPSAERKGKWLDPVVPEDDPFVHLPYCSACGCEIEVDAYCEPLFTEYCPHCGARMERREE